jgi:hypothetical protein
MGLLIHLLIACLFFGVLYWIITLVVSILPSPIAPVARVVLLVVLALIALSFLLGEVGLVDVPWGRYPRYR